MLDRWDASTRLANWAVTELLRAEPERLAGGKIAKLDCYLYGQFGSSELRTEWAGNTGSAAAILRWAEARYRALRFNVQVTHSCSAPTFRWPVPFIVREQDYTIAYNEERQHFTLAVPIGDQRFVLRIRNDRTARLQTNRLREVIAGRAAPGELRLMGYGVSPNDRRNGIAFRRPGGGDSQWVRLYRKL